MDTTETHIWIIPTKQILAIWNWSYTMVSIWQEIEGDNIRIVIQIKICAEYRDMLPRPRLVCQEPGLRPIGRSPGVPDKSSRGLGSMSRYSAQILIGNFAGLPVCTVPSAMVHCNQNEAGHQTIKPPRMPCWGAADPSNTLAFKSQTGENDR